MPYKYFYTMIVWGKITGFLKKNPVQIEKTLGVLWQFYLFQLSDLRFFLTDGVSMK